MSLKLSSHVFSSIILVWCSTSATGRLHVVYQIFLTWNVMSDLWRWANNSSLHQRKLTSMNPSITLHYKEGNAYMWKWVKLTNLYICKIYSWGIIQVHDAMYAHCRCIVEASATSMMLLFVNHHLIPKGKGMLSLTKPYVIYVRSCTTVDIYLMLVHHNMMKFLNHLCALSLNNCLESLLLLLSCQMDKICVFRVA